MSVSLSIVTVVRNGAATIRSCVESVRGQAYPREHVVWDGGSTDGTLEILKSYGDAIRLFSGADSGIYDAMNKGIARAGGDVIGILNADDFYADGTCLAEVAKVFDDPDVESSYADLDYVDARDPGRVTRRWIAGPCTRRGFYWGWMPPHPTFFVRREVYDRFGTFDTSLGTAADYELVLRLLLRHRVSTAYIPRVLVKMRTGGASNASLASRVRANRMDRRAWRVNGLRAYPWTLVSKPLRKVGQFL